MHYTTDPSVTLCAAAREAEAAFHAALALDPGAPDTADDALFDALEVVPSSVQGIREKISLALDVEGVNWPDDVSTLLRSFLLSPVLAA